MLRQAFIAYEYILPYQIPRHDVVLNIIMQVKVAYYARENARGLNPTGFLLEEEKNPMFPLLQYDQPAVGVAQLSMTTTAKPSME